VPESIIAATLVAFGTSLPEFVTGITAARKGHGELAVGNVIGANILNVLFVVGASAAVTRGGLAAPVAFFKIFFPAMLFMLIILITGTYLSENSLKRSFGILLLGSYIFITIMSYTYRMP
jgi:cation:H+ antiporter